MPGRQGSALVILLCFVWAGAVGKGGAWQEERRSVWDGVYSEPQAGRGLKEYTRACERCHGSDLTGNATDEVPALVADLFLFHWGGRTVQDLYDRIRKTMPADASGSLDASAYLDIVAYLLEANGFPRGAQELDRSRLSAIVIERAPSR